MPPPEDLERGHRSASDQCGPAPADRQHRREDVKMLGEGEWKTKKHGADYRRQWRKVHLGIDAQTLEIRGSAPSISRTTPLAMSRCCRSCWRRFLQTNNCIQCKRRLRTPLDAGST